MDSHSTGAAPDINNICFLVNSILRKYCERGLHVPVGQLWKL